MVRLTGNRETGNGQREPDNVLLLHFSCFLLNEERLGRAHDDAFLAHIAFHGHVGIAVKEHALPRAFLHAYAATGAFMRINYVYAIIFYGNRFNRAYLCANPALIADNCFIGARFREMAFYADCRLLRVDFVKMNHCACNLAYPATGAFGIVSVKIHISELLMKNVISNFLRLKEFSVRHPAGPIRIRGDCFH